MSSRTWTLTAAHVGSDLGQGAVPALAAYFAVREGYDLTQVAGLILAVNLGSSLVQPALGAVADRVRWRWSAPLGVSLAGIGLAAVGVAPSYPLILAALLVSGLGIALFHPEGGRLAAAAGDAAHRSRSMSVFALGGNAGFALGPLLATPVALGLGAPGIVLLGALPIALAAPLALDLWRDREQPASKSNPGSTPAPTGDTTGGLSRRSGDDTGPREAGTRDTRAADTRDATAAPTADPAVSAAEKGPRSANAAFAQLTAVITLRSSAYYALQALLPAFFITVLAQSLTTANAALTTMLVCGTLATLVGGWRAGRHVQMPLITWPLLALAAGLALLPFADRSVWGFVLAGALGVATFAGFSPSVVLGQRYLPARTGLAAGVAFGLAPGIGSLVALTVAQLADRHGLADTMLWLVLLPVIAIPLAFGLPAPAAEPKAESEASSNEVSARSDSES